MLELENPERRRTFFDKLAEAKNFDPLDTEKWNSIPKKDITSTMVIIHCKFAKIKLTWLLREDYAFLIIIMDLSQKH
jgi:hypothetical protein